MRNTQPFILSEIVTAAVEYTARQARQYLLEDRPYRSTGRKSSRLNCDESLNSRLACRGDVAFRKARQFSFRHSEFGGATIQTDNNLWKYPHDRLVNVFQAGKMDAYLSSELALVD